MKLLEHAKDATSIFAFFYTGIMLYVMMFGTLRAFQNVAPITIFFLALNLILEAQIEKFRLRKTLRESQVLTVSDIIGKGRDIRGDSLY